MIRTRMELLEFVRANKKKISEKIGSELSDVFMDNFNDVASHDMDENTGFAFRWPEHVDETFEGENGDEPMPLIVNDVQIYYVAFNI